MKTNFIGDSLEKGDSVMVGTANKAEGSKIGIITLPGRFNFGNRLQCYAVSQKIKNMGCNPVALELDDPVAWTTRLKRLILKLAGKEILTPNQMRTPARKLAFERFNEMIQTESFKHPSCVEADNFDKIVVGSDQVWNPDYIRHQEGWYFARFAKPEQRIALSASLGIDSFRDRTQAKRISKGVKGFSSISVREAKGAELIKSCSNRDVEVLVDPTLSMTAKEWREVADSRLTPDKPYVFTYLLGGVNAEASEVLEQVALNNSLEVISLTDRQKPGELDAGPAEFIDLIDHAEHVITDSFHAAVFAMLLGTPLTITHRDGGASMFSRLEQLADTFGLWDKIAGSSSFDLSHASEYPMRDEALLRERERFTRYLRGVLGIPEEGGGVNGR